MTPAESEGLVQGAQPAEEPAQEAVQEPAQESAQDPEKGGMTAVQVADDHPKLRMIQEQLMQKVPPELHSAVDRIVIAGMKMMFGKETHEKVMAQLEKLGSPSDGVAMGIAGMLTMIAHAAKGPMPIPALIPASIILMCQALDFLAKSNKIELTNELIADTTKKLQSYMMQKLGLDANKIAEIQAQQGMPPEGMQGAPQGGPQAPQGMPQDPQGGLISGAM